MADMLSQAKYILSETDPARLGRCAVEVAFVGRSNVGKSSLLNALCRQKNLARTSKTPGRTRAINVFAAAKNSWIVDLPGYGFAVGPEQERRSWQRMIEGYLSGRDTLRMIFVLVDAKVGATPLDVQMIGWLRHFDLPFRVVANKVDRVGVPQREDRVWEIANALGCRKEDVLPASAAKGTGVDVLRREVIRVLLDR